MPQNRLVHLNERSSNMEDLDEALVNAAYSIETSLLRIGAVPKEDYTYVDLIKLAMEFLCRESETGYSI